MDDAMRAALERLLDIATSDTGQSRRVANFILTSWNVSLGGFDLSDIFAVDRDIARAMATVVAHLAESAAAEYPEAYRAEVENLIKLWRPEHWTRSGGT
jgi:hypothetical protein